MSKWMDIAFKILAALVIPLLGWGVRLEVTRAVQAEKITQLEKEVAAVQDVRKGLVDANLTLAKLGEKVDAANQRLGEIKSDLRRSLPPE